MYAICILNSERFCPARFSVHLSFAHIFSPFLPFSLAICVCVCVFTCTSRIWATLIETIKYGERMRKSSRPSNSSVKVTESSEMRRKRKRSKTVYFPARQLLPPVCPLCVCVSIQINHSVMRDWGFRFADSTQSNADFSCGRFTLHIRFRISYATIEMCVCVWLPRWPWSWHMWCVHARCTCVWVPIPRVGKVRASFRVRWKGKKKKVPHS